MRHSLLPWRLFDTNVRAPATQVTYGVFCVATGMVQVKNAKMMDPGMICWICIYIYMYSIGCRGVPVNHQK